jgi:hypothetical protein
MAMQHFMHDGAPAHRAIPVKNWLNRQFPSRWYGNNGPIKWPPRSPDLTVCDFWLWGYIKAQVFHHQNRPVNLNDLENRIRDAFHTITPMMLQRSFEAYEHRLTACLLKDGGHVEIA